MRGPIDARSSSDLGTKPPKPIRPVSKGVGPPDRVQHMHAVRGDLQATADAGRIGPSLINLGLDAGLAEEDGRHGAGDAGADDQRFAGALGHVLLHASGWCYERSLANYLIS